MNFKHFKSRVFAAIGLWILLGSGSVVLGAGPVKEAGSTCPRFSLPQSVLTKPLHFAGETIPLQRADVRSRIEFQVNFLLLDARSVVTLWLSEGRRKAWILREVFEKQGIPGEFVWLAPIMSRLKRGDATRHKGGVWALDTPCKSGEVPKMISHNGYDDRMDVELSTKCFASRIKRIRKDLGHPSWLMAATAYMTSVKEVQDLMKHWNTQSFWDIPFTENPELLIPRWIALAVIGTHLKEYGLNFKKPPPMTFDQITGISLAKDLPVADIARMTGVPPRVILELNPKISPATGLFPAKVGGKPAVHTMAAPRGQGNTLVRKLKKEGFLSLPKK